MFPMFYTGHPEYGCFISKEKTLTNFDCEDNLLNPIIPSESGMWPHCYSPLYAEEKI